jgi:hypothetical protein
MDFKRGIVKPIHKSGGKNGNGPGSYRPLCILSSLIKVLETTVKWDITAHFAKIGAVPTTQHGFRAGRSCMTARLLAHKPAASKASREGKWSACSGST